MRTSSENLVNRLDEPQPASTRQRRSKPKAEAREEASSRQVAKTSRQSGAASPVAGSKDKNIKEATPGDDSSAVAATAAAAACVAELLSIAEAVPVSSPETEDAACLIPNPVNLQRTKSPFPVAFAKNLTLDCPFAVALARYTNDTAQALARHHLATAITSIHSGEGFVCRRRNNAATGKLSEHAFGNATDWVSFKFADGSRLGIQDTSLVDIDEANFLNALRSAACGAFTTVLGPGSNAAHVTHFHFDLGRSKDRKNPYRICE